MVGSPCSPRGSQKYSLTPQSKSTNSLALSLLMVQLSQPYMTTGKTIALTRWTFVYIEDEDETVGWRHRLNEHEFVQASGAGDGQGSLACCSPWGLKELDMIE